MTRHTKSSFRYSREAETRFLEGSKGFTLAELIIIVLTASLSVAVTIPICSINHMNAKLSEADANLGNIRTQLRIYYNNNSEYPTATSKIPVAGAPWNDINTTELNGRYFMDSSYTYVSMAGKQFTITCEGESLLHSDRMIDETGVFSGGI